MWIIQGKGPNCNVFWRNPYNTIKETDFKPCNELRPYSMEKCLDYILTYSDTGDTISINGIPHICMEQANG